MLQDKVYKSLKIQKYGKFSGGTFKILFNWNLKPWTLQEVLIFTNSKLFNVI